MKYCENKDYVVRRVSTISNIFVSIWLKEIEGKHRFFNESKKFSVECILETEP